MYAMLPSTLRERKCAAMTTAMTVNTAASAQDTCAAFTCAAMNNCMIIILDAALLASIFVLLLDLITGKRTAVHRSPICRLF